MIFLLLYVIGYLSALWFHSITRERITLGDMGTALFMGLLGPLMLLICLFTVMGNRSSIVVYQKSKPKSDEEFLNNLEENKPDEQS